MEAAGEGGPVRYRSRAGSVAFGLWGVGGMVVVVVFGWAALSAGAPLMLLGPIWFGVILAYGAHLMSLDVTVDVEGELRFRGLFHQRRWNVAQLRSIAPGRGCVVFRFEEGSAMLAGGPGRDWAGLVAHILACNPEVRVTLQASAGSGSQSRSGDR